MKVNIQTYIFGSYSSMKKMQGWGFIYLPSLYHRPTLLRASCLTLEIKEFKCYEAIMEESEKAGSHLHGVEPS